MKMIRQSLHYWQQTRHIVSEQYNRLCDLLFGPFASTLTDAAPLPVMLPLPEGIYYGNITYFIHKIGRRSLPLATARVGSIVALYGGIPLGNERGSVVSISSPETGIQAALCDVLRCIDVERAGWLPKEEVEA